MSPDAKATIYDVDGNPKDVGTDCVELEAGFVADTVLTTDRCVRLFVETGCDDAEPFLWIVEPEQDLTYLDQYGPYVKAAVLL